VVSSVLQPMSCGLLVLLAFFVCLLGLVPCFLACFFVCVRGSVCGGLSGTAVSRSEHATTLDSMQHTLHKGDRVKVVTGKFKGKEGTIKHICRNTLFLHSYHHLDHNGVFSARGLHVVGVGLKVRALSPCSPRLLVPRPRARAPGRDVAAFTVAPSWSLARAFSHLPVTIASTI
jgi:hypothetical protein